MQSIKSLIGTLVILLVAGCSSKSIEFAHDHHREDPTENQVQEAMGPNGGRLLSGAGLSLEIKILDEPGGARFIVWGVDQNGKPKPVDGSGIRIVTERLGGETEEFRLESVGGRLQSSSVIKEPHSFTVGVKAQLNNDVLQWSYDSFEGRTQIDSATANEAGLISATVGQGVIRDVIEAQGFVRPHERSTAKVIARFPGVVKSIRVREGDQVAAGDVLATVESNASLSVYSVVSPISGTVISRSVEVGAPVEQTILFEVSNTETVRIDLRVFGRSAKQVKRGSPVTVRRLLDDETAQTSVSLIAPGADELTQSVVVQALVKNSDTMWRPGMAVQGDIEISSSSVLLAIPAESLQTWRDMSVAFVQVGDIYEVRPIKIGRRDRNTVEVLSGITAGDRVVVRQSYLIKADIEKSGASHDH